jgi:hypothetical protein
MDKYYLKSQIKSTRSAYLYFCCVGAHYLYLGKLVTQFIFWMTLGGFGIWAVFDLFTLSEKGKNHNNKILQEIDLINQQEGFTQEPRNVALLKNLNIKEIDAPNN